MGKGKRNKKAKKVKDGTKKKRNEEPMVNIPMTLSNAENTKHGLMKSSIPTVLAIPLIEIIQREILKVVNAGKPKK